MQCWWDFFTNVVFFPTEDKITFTIAYYFPRPLNNSFRKFVHSDKQNQL